MSGKKEEKRAHYRFDMSYPVRILTPDGQEITIARTLNVSRHGTLLAVPAHALEKLGDSVHVSISLPKSSYEAEKVSDFACKAQVIRRQQIENDHSMAIALEFSEPMHLEMN